MSIPLAIAETCSCSLAAACVDAVREHDDGATLLNLTGVATFERDGARRLRDCVVERRLSKRGFNAGQRGVERREVRGKSHDAIQARVEGEDGRFVARLQRAEDMPRGLPRVGHLGPEPHAAADVEQHRDLHWTVGLRAEIEDLPCFPAFRDDEVGLRQIADEPPLPVAHDRADRHEVDRRPERRLALRPGPAEPPRPERATAWRSSPRSRSDAPS